VPVLVQLIKDVLSWYTWRNFWTHFISRLYCFYWRYKLNHI